MKHLRPFVALHITWLLAFTSLLVVKAEAQRVDVKLNATSVNKIQYQGATGFVDIPATLYVLKGTSVTFKAIPAPDGSVWPANTPTWGGVASGTGATTAVAFNTLSTSATDFKTVTAALGNTITVNVVVYDINPIAKPADQFSPTRSQTTYGIGETVNLSFTTSPSGVTPDSIQWTVVGGGIVNANTYTASPTPGAVTLTLRLTTGPSLGVSRSLNPQVIAPSTGSELNFDGTDQKYHLQNTTSAAFYGYFIASSPTSVSFAKVKIREVDVTAFTATGMLASFAGLYHKTGTTTPSTTLDWSPLFYDNTLKVWRVGSSTPANDLADAVGFKLAPDKTKYGVTGYAAGSAIYKIPWNYQVTGGSDTKFDTVIHDSEVVDNTGAATQSKGGVNVGPILPSAATNPPHFPPLW